MRNNWSEEACIESYGLQRWVQLTVAREVLANIVRARYADPMQFIMVSSINAQFSVNVSGSGDVGRIGQAGAVGGLAFRFARTTPGWHELGLRFSFGAIDGATDCRAAQYESTRRHQ
jgi:hypothetical protein